MNATAHNTELIQTLTSLDFSHVFYDTEDPVSLALACLSLTPQVLLVSYATLMLSRREMETFMMFAGQLASELLNEFIKRLIKQDRPNELCKFTKQNFPLGGKETVGDNWLAFLVSNIFGYPTDGTESAEA